LRPIADTHHLMELFNEPLYEYLKKGLEQQPADDRAWTGVAQNATRVAEITNLVMIRKRGEDQPKVWRTKATTVRQVALDLQQQAENQNLEASREAFRQLVQSCNDCHSTFARGHAPQLKP